MRKAGIAWHQDDWGQIMTMSLLVFAVFSSFRQLVLQILQPRSALATNLSGQFTETARVNMALSAHALQQVSEQLE